MRIFIAIDIDAAIQKRIGEIQKRLIEETDLKRGVTWVRPEQIHLTLNFLGEVPDDAVCQVCRIAEEAAQRSRAFELEVKGLGTFGKPARVLWAGMRIVPELASLQRDLEERLEAAGWPRESRAFAAHLTLCRIKDAQAGRTLAEASEVYRSAVLGPISVEEVVVYESQLTRAGAIYTAVSRSELKNR